MRRILALLILLAIPAVAQFGGPMGGMRPGSMQGGGLLPGRGGDPLWVAAGPTKPTLDFDFAKRKDLTDAVSGKTSLVNFSRSAAQSPGTYVGADGLIHDAAVNLALYSEQFDNGAWVKSGATVEANQILAPDGKQTADKINISGGDFLYRYPNISSGVYTFSAWYRGEPGQTVVMQIRPFASPDILKTITFTGEWQRESITSENGVVYFYPVDTRPGGTTATSFYIWGAQLEETDPATMQPTAYIKTTSQALAAPRFDHDPVTGESLGLLVEEARTNFFTNSDSFATQNVTTTSTAYTLSFYGTGTIDLTGTHTATVVGSGAYPARTTLTFTPTAGTLTATVTGTVQYAQLEQGTFPTSYIPTVTSQTRYADVAAVQDEDFSTTNLLAYSESFDVGSLLTGFDAFGAGSVANAIESPDGQTTADFLRPSTATGFKGVGQSTSFPATATKTVYVKDSGVRYVQLVYQSTRSINYANYDLQNIEVTQTGGPAVVGASIFDAGNGWLRLVITETGAVTTADHFVTPIPSPTSARAASFTGDGISGFYVWGESLTATEYPVEYTTTRNLLTDSQDFERWSASNSTVDDDAAQAPDGTLTADKLQETTAGGQKYFAEGASGTGQFVLSAYFKADERSRVYLQMILTTGGIVANFDLASGTVASQYGYSGAATPSSTITSVGNGWYRCEMAMGASSGLSQARIAVANDAGSTSYAGVDGYGVFVWGAQLEPGATPTDYVRTVDTVGKAYGFYEHTEGTFLAKGDTEPTRSGGFIGLGTGIGTIYKAGNTVTEDAGWWNGSSFVGTPNTSSSWDINANISASYSYLNRNICLDGGAVATSATDSPIGDKIRIGQYYDGSNPLNGHIKRLTYWPRRQADSTLQVITQ